MKHHLVLSGTGSDFTVYLRQPLDLTHGDWHVALLNVTFEPSKDSTLYVYSNLCEHRLIGDTIAPLLDTVFVTKDLLTYDSVNPIHVPAVKESLNFVRFTLCMENGQPFPLTDKSKVFVKLQLKK